MGGDGLRRGPVSGVHREHGIIHARQYCRALDRLLDMGLSAKVHSLGAPLINLGRAIAKHNHDSLVR